jgi:hypothetical protein
MSEDPASGVFGATAQPTPMTITAHFPDTGRTTTEVATKS